MIYTTQQAAELLGISQRRVQAAVKSGVLQARKVGRDWQITGKAIEAYRVEHLGKPGRPGRE